MRVQEEQGGGREEARESGCRRSEGAWGEGAAGPTAPQEPAYNLTN